MGRQLRCAPLPPITTGVKFTELTSVYFKLEALSLESLKRLIVGLHGQLQKVKDFIKRKFLGEGYGKARELFTES